MLEVIVDHGMCMSAGECVFNAPATFAFGADNRAVVIDPSGDGEEAILEAAAACPNFAITVRRDGITIFG